MDRFYYSFIRIWVSLELFVRVFTGAYKIKRECKRDRDVDRVRKSIILIVLPLRSLGKCFKTFGNCELKCVTMIVLPVSSGVIVRIVRRLDSAVLLKVYDLLNKLFSRLVLCLIVVEKVLKFITFIK